MKCGQQGVQCNARTDAVRERGGITGRANKHGQPGLTEQCNLSEVHIRTEPSTQEDRYKCKTQHSISF